MDYSEYIKSVMSGRFNMIDGMEEASRNLAKLPKKELKRLTKKAEKFIRDRCEDTSGYGAEYDDINNNPNLSDSEIRIALCDARRRYAKQKIEFFEEMDRWNQEIREEEARRAKLAKLVKPATITEKKKRTEGTVGREESEESEAESESESEDPRSYDSDSD